MLCESVDLLTEFSDTSESSAPDGSLGDDIEPDFDLVEPRGIRWGEVYVVARSTGEPAFDFGVLVCAVVVDD